MARDPGAEAPSDDDREQGSIRRPQEEHVETAQASEMLSAQLERAASCGMTTAVRASAQPDRTAVIDLDGETRTFFQVNANANRIVRRFPAAGLRVGDAIALICSNRHEFIEVLAAALRGGYRLTPVNWHLTADEIGYISGITRRRLCSPTLGSEPRERRPTSRRAFG